MVATAAAIMGGVAALGTAGAGIYSAMQQPGGAAGANNSLALRQYYEDRRRAQLQEALATAPVRDAQGNQTSYTPGVGWTTTLSPQQQRIQNASDVEQERQLTQDAPRARMARENAFRQTLLERLMADSARRRLQQPGRTQEQVRDAGIRTGMADMMANPNALRQAVNLTALRSGTGGETTLANLARNSGTDRRAVLARAGAEAPRLHAEERASVDAPDLARYMQLSGRTAAGDNYLPQGAVNADNANLTRARQQMVAPQSIGSAMRLNVPTVRDTDDRIGQRIAAGAQAVGGIANNQDIRDALGAIFGNSQRRQQPQQSLDDMWSGATW